MRTLVINVVLLSAFALLFPPQGHAAGASRDVHGSADAFAEPGIALAWGVLRGKNEDTTVVVLRVVADSNVYADVSVTGVDPFSGQRRVILAPTPVAGMADLHILRAHFAAYPRTEVLLQPSAPPNQSATLRVYYLGVPDTTPEFADEVKLDAYLRARLAQAQRSPPP